MFKRRAGSLVSALIAAVISALIFVLLMIVMKVYPFGEGTLLFGNGDLYVSLFGSVPGLTQSPDGVFYSWSAAMGSDMTELSAAYLFSPLNLLSLALPRNPLLGFHLAAGLRLSLAAFVFCLWLSRKEGLHIWSRTLFGVIYAFSGYAVACLANTSVTDGVVLLPLIALGVVRIKEGKGILLYVLALSMAVLTGYRMIAVFALSSLLFYLKGVFEEPGSGTRLKRTFLPWAAGSLLAVGISAIVILPVWLTAHPGAHFSLPEFIRLSGDPRLILTGLFTGTMGGDVPPVFAGIIIEVLAVMYFLNGNIPFRKKILSLLVILAALATFIFPIPYLFRENVVLGALDSRCSLILVFMIADMAAETRGGLSHMSLPGLALSLFICSGALAAMVTFRGVEVVAAAAVADAMFILSAVVLVWFITKKESRPAAIILTLLALVNAAGNSWVILHEDVKERSAADFYDLYDKTEGALGLTVRDDLYRTASTFSWGRNDSLLHGFGSADGYIPGQKGEGPAYAAMLGIPFDGEQSLYSERGNDLPESSDALMSIRRLMARDQDGLKTYRKAGSHSGVDVYENTYAVPLITAVNSLPEITGENSFEIQNELWKCYSGLEGDVFSEVGVRSTVRTSDTLVTLTGNSKPLYMWVPDGNAEIKITAGGESKEYVHQPGRNIYYVGAPENSIRATVVITPEQGDKTDYRQSLVYAEDLDVLRLHADAAQKAGVTLEKLSPSHLKGECEIKKGSGYLLTTIPADQGWSITVDGRTAVGGADDCGTLAFAVTEGKHVIEMTYRPSGFVAGLIISAVSLLLLLVFVIIHTGQIRRYRREDREKEEEKRRLEEEAKTPEVIEPEVVEPQPEETPEELPQMESPYEAPQLTLTEPEPEGDTPEETDAGETAPEETAETLPEVMKGHTGFFKNLFSKKNQETEENNNEEE